VNFLMVALWGALGATGAGLSSLVVSITAAGFRWPWRESIDIFPRLFIAIISIILGAFVAAAAHAEIVGPWPALLIGATAPSVVRGLLSRIEVEGPPPKVDHTSPSRTELSDGQP
jgi:hypothetical protein